MANVRDFENGEAGFGQATPVVVAALVARICDMSLVVDEKGVVRDASFGEGDIAKVASPGLLGRPLVDAVTSESRGKVDELLAGVSPAGRWRQVNLPTPDEDVPVGLQAFSIGGRRTLVVARDQRRLAIAQRRFVEATRDAEREQARQRGIESRLRAAVTLADLSIATVDPVGLRIVEANERALADLDAAVGVTLPDRLDPEDAEDAREALLRVAGSARAVTFDARTRAGRTFDFSAIAVREGGALRCVVTMSPSGVGERLETALIARAPHPIVVTDETLTIENVNRAFVDNVQLSSAGNAVGQSLDRFVGRGGIDTRVVAAALRDGPLVRGFATVLTSLHGRELAVEADGMRLPGGRFGFLLRLADGGGRRAAGDRAGLVERLTDVVGRIELKEIVRETTDLIERRCIETALDLTGNSRAAAAEMLGISRQSLYAKLARYGIGGREDPIEPS